MPMLTLTNAYGNQRHRVIAENVDHFHGYGIPTRPVICVHHGGKFQVPVLAGAEALPLIFENIATGPAVFKFWQRQFTLRGFESRQ